MSSMIREDAEELLTKYHGEAYKKAVHQVNDRIRCYVAYGHSNCIVIEGDTSLILVDALDSNVRGERLKQELATWTDKPVKTIIYTHGHPDHRGGAGAFRDTVEEVIAFAPKRPALKYYDKLADVLNARTVRQFGYHLTDEEVITQGLGIREGSVCGEGQYDMLLPTTLYTESSLCSAQGKNTQDQIERVIDGIPFKLVSAVGETDDQIFVWLPEDKVLCCGDNYYACWPNLYAIRGSQYRDIAAWVDSLEVILSYPAEVLLPGHTNPLFGYEAIQDVLGHYRGAIESVLLQTIDCMNRGMSEADTVSSVRLPEEYRNKPYLGEYYGTVDWSVRAIYHGYLGWFDGNPSNLNPLPDEMYAKKLVELIGVEKLIAEIKDNQTRGEYQLALQFCDLLIQAGANRDIAMQEKQQALLALSHVITSANGRHYYQESAAELEITAE